MWRVASAMAAFSNNEPKQTLTTTPRNKDVVDRSRSSTLRNSSFRYVHIGHHGFIDQRKKRKERELVCEDLVVIFHSVSEDSGGENLGLKPPQKRRPPGRSIVSVIPIGPSHMGACPHAGATEPIVGFGWKRRKKLRDKSMVLQLTEGKRKAGGETPHGITVKRLRSDVCEVLCHVK